MGKYQFVQVSNVQVHHSSKLFTVPPKTGTSIHLHYQQHQRHLLAFSTTSAYLPDLICLPAWMNFAASTLVCSCRQRHMNKDLGKLQGKGGIMQHKMQREEENRKTKWLMKFYPFTVIHVVSLTKLSCLYFNLKFEPILIVLTVNIFLTMMTNQNFEYIFSWSSVAYRT